MFTNFLTGIINTYKTSSINSLFENLEYADIAKSKKILESYLNSGGDVNVRNKYGLPLINFITANGNNILLQFLINRGADINIKDDNGNTPLLISIDRKDIVNAKLLIQSGANINCTNNFNYSPLAYAIGIADINLVKILLDDGADINIKIDDSRYDYIDVYTNTHLVEFTILLSKKHDNNILYLQIINYLINSQNIELTKSLCTKIIKYWNSINYTQSIAKNDTMNDGYLAFNKICNKLKEYNINLNNKKNGLYKTYYDTGELKEQISYFYGEINGSYAIFNKDGSNKEYRQYKNNILCNIRYYGTDGLVVKYVEYESDGKTIKYQDERGRDF